MDPKTAVVQFCQRYCKRSISKTDIVYNVTKIAAMPGGSATYVCKLSMPCIDENQEFDGMPADKAKDAEKSAASVALEAFAPLLATLEPAGGQNKKKKPNNKKRKAT